MKSIEIANTSAEKSRGMTRGRQERMPDSDIAAWREERRKEREEREKERKKQEKKYLGQGLLILISVLISGISIGISICTMIIRCLGLGVG